MRDGNKRRFSPVHTQGWESLPPSRGILGIFPLGGILGIFGRRKTGLKTGFLFTVFNMRQGYWIFKWLEE